MTGGAGAGAGVGADFALEACFPAVLLVFLGVGALLAGAVEEEWPLILAAFLAAFLLGGSAFCFAGMGTFLLASSFFAWLGCSFA